MRIVISYAAKSLSMKVGDPKTTLNVDENLAARDARILPRGRITTLSTTRRLAWLLGRPVAVAVAAGSDGSNAARQMERICRGWRLAPVADTLVSQNGLVQTKANILQPKVLDAGMRDRCHELGGLVAGPILLSDEG